MLQEGRLNKQGARSYTQKEDKIYLHLLDYSGPTLSLPGISQKIKSAKIYGSDTKVKFKQHKEDILLEINGKQTGVIDLIVELSL